MRYKNCPVQERSIKYSDNYRSFSALNFLGKTPWKINKTVLDLVSAIWDEGGNQNYIPNRYS
jgi:DNA-directed RNA polymerase